MNISRAILVLAAVILVLSSCGKRESEDIRNAKGQKQVMNIPESSERPVDAPGNCDAVYYDIRLYDNSVKLFEIDGAESLELKSVEIDREYYPSEDISRLEQGITAYNREMAYEILENFAN